MGGSLKDEGNSLAMDSSGNVYVTGWFQGKAFFGEGTKTISLISSGESDIFTAKYDNSGNLLWVKQMRGDLNDGGYAIALDKSNNVYTAGFFKGTVDFNPDSGIYELTSSGDFDIFITKLDSSGNFIWVKSFGGSYSDGGNSITVDASGNVYTIGFFIDTVDFDPGVGTANLTSSEGTYDTFVQKLDASGNFIWAHSFGGISTDYGNAITVDASGNVYTTGNFEDTVDFDPGAGTANLTSVGLEDIFVQKLDASGNFIWAKSFGASDEDEGSSITVDALGNVYTTGYFQGTVDFDPGVGTNNFTSAGFSDVFIQKMSQGITGIGDIAKGIQIKAYPNPSKGLVQLLFSQALNNVEITLADLQGKVVFTKNLDAAFNEQINIDGSAGIYFLHVKTPEGQSVVKLIKE